MRINNIKPQLAVLTPAKSRIIARLKGDGSIFVGGRRRTNYLIKYESNDKHELDIFSRDIMEVYGLSTKEEIHRSGKKPNKFLKQVFVRSKLAFLDLQKYGPFSSREWTVPNSIKSSNLSIRTEFLRTFFEDEGSVINSYGHKELRLYSINLRGLKELINMLESFGIESKLRGGFGEGRNVYALVISDVKSIMKFKNEIGFSSARKRLKMEKLTSKSSFS
ncbi:MAG: LAGLIDADG family homing endonuclease [Candidatus Aenigmatarchaeota archaeon]